MFLGPWAELAVTFHMSYGLFYLVFTNMYWDIDVLDGRPVSFEERKSIYFDFFSHNFTCDGRKATICSIYHIAKFSWKLTMSWSVLQVFFLFLFVVYIAWRFSKNRERGRKRKLMLFWLQLYFRRYTMYLDSWFASLIQYFLQPEAI